jgi:hypothetical protein
MNAENTVALIIAILIGAYMLYCLFWAEHL